MNPRPVNTDFSTVLADYLSQRRSLGYALVEEERHARRFLEWLFASGTTGSTFTALQVATWARGNDNLKVSYQRQRLGAVKALARYCYAMSTADINYP